MGWKFYDSTGAVYHSSVAADGSITNAKMAADSVDSAQYVDGSIDTAHIGNDQVTGAKLNPSLVLGDIIYADGTDTIARLAKGSEDEVLTMGGSNAPTWAAAGSGAITREGGNLTEATTTSTSAVDLLSVTSLNIEEINYISGRSLHRKTSGAEADAGGGLKLNSTVIAEAVATGGIGVRLTGVMATTNAAFSGVAEWNIPGTVTNYAIGGATGVSNFGGSSYVTYASTSDRPASANITSVITRAITLNASNTWGHDEVHVYTWATS